MELFLIYKGKYDKQLRGPEIRYLSLARAMVEEGHRVSLASQGLSKQHQPSAITWVDLGNKSSVLRAFYRADVIVLHGGGPVLLALATIFGLFGKKILLDSYAPHWIELTVEQEHYPSWRLALKIFINNLRITYGTLMFDGLLVANQRQLDLMRGFSAVWWRSQGFNRIHMLSFGASTQVATTTRAIAIEQLNKLLTFANQPLLSDDDFIIGWLGGTYAWFDMEGLIKLIQPALSANRSIKLVLFGVESAQQKPMLAHLEQSLHRQLVFAPWVDYEKRFHYWSAMDLALVWAADNYENDYASRTRNFDCLSLGLPIVQNHDAEWSARLQSSEAGFVTTADQLANLLLTLSQQPESLQLYRQRMLTNLLPEFAWPKIARQLLGISQKLPRLTLVRRLFGSFIFLATLPVWLLLLLTEMGQRISSLWKKN